MPHLKSQEDILEKRITVTFGRITKYEALKRIGFELGISFSYKEGLLRNNDIVYIDYKDVTVRKILDDLFQEDRLEYICNERTIIIKRKIVTFNKDSANSKQVPGECISDRTENQKIELTPVLKLNPLLDIRISPEDTVSWESDLILSFLANDPRNDSDNTETLIDQKAYYDSPAVTDRSFHLLKDIVLQEPNVLTNRNRQTFYIKNEKCYDRGEYGGGCNFKETVFVYKTCIALSPHLTYIPDTKIRAGVEGGFLQDISYKNKLTLSFGTQFSTQHIRLNPDEESDSSSSQITIHYVIVPVSIAYNVTGSKYSGTYISAGLYQYLFTNRDLPYISSNPGLEWLPYLNISAGFEKTWFSKFTWFIEPFFRLPMAENVHFKLLTKFGVTFGIKFIETPVRPY